MSHQQGHQGLLLRELLLEFKGTLSLHLQEGQSSYFSYHLKLPLLTILCVCVFVLYRVFGTSMVEEYEEIAESQYPSERLEYLDEDYGK